MKKQRKLRDPYSVLKVPRSATPEDIKLAYRKKALRDHPDRNPGDEAAAARFRRATEAYEILSDPVRRKHYDETGEVKPPEAMTEDREDILHVLSQLVVEAGAEVDGEGKELADVDFVDRMKAVAHRYVRERREKIENLKDGSKNLQEILDRTVEEEPGGDLVREAVRVNRTHNELAAGQAEYEIDIFEKCLAVLAKTRFKRRVAGKEFPDQDSPQTWNRTLRSLR